MFFGIQTLFKVKAFFRYFFGCSIDSDCAFWVDGICGINYKNRQKCKGYYNCVYLKVTR